MDMTTNFKAKLPTLSVVIPTYLREQVLIDTVSQLINLNCPADQIIVVDQSSIHEESTKQALSEFDRKGLISWIKREQPSVTAAMNAGIQLASSELILFLDDDVVIDHRLVLAHKMSYSDKEIAVVAGKVIQPWDDNESLQKRECVDSELRDPDSFPFNISKQCFVKRFMGGNVSVRKNIALQIGGFDEQFSRVAYRFEAEFADRIVRQGLKILYEPAASLNHLHTPSGGTRVFGDTFNTIRPNHSVGRYYYLLRAKSAYKRYLKIIHLPFTTLITRQNLKKPWRIPGLFIAEILGLGWASIKIFQGPKLLRKHKNN